jgi:hypothetical protein
MREEDGAKQWTGPARRGGVELCEGQPAGGAGETLPAGTAERRPPEVKTVDQPQSGAARIADSPRNLPEL